MAILIRDFVNREGELDTLWKIIRREMEQRLVLILGPSGIGKTYFLDESSAECEKEGISCARIDFTEGSSQDYMALILSIWNQLGPEGFEVLTKTITESRHLSAWETVPTLPLSKAEPLVANPISSDGRSGGVDFYGSTTIHGDVIGRDVIYLTQVIQRDDPWVQQMIQAQITSAFRDCLIEYATARNVIFFFDSWERATTDTRGWLYQNLLNWIFHQKLPKALAVVAGREASDLQRSFRHVGLLTLAKLPDEAIQVYWVERYGLPLEDVPAIVKYSGGKPILIALLAEQQAAQVKGISS